MIGVDGQQVSVSDEVILCHVEVAYSSEGAGKGHEYVFFEDLGDCVLVCRDDDGVHHKEPHLEIVIG